MLKSIIIVTIAVQQLAGIGPAYEKEFDYRTVHRGPVPAALASAWDAPEMAGRKHLLMQPASGAEVYLRFVETPDVEGYKPLATHGWNATELLVKDPDAVAAQLEDSDFEIIGPPKDLWEAPNAPRALQALGPGDEVLYLTRNDNFETRTAVDRVFIMVVGGPSMAAFRDFYGTSLGLAVGEPTPFTISVLSDAQGLPASTTYPLAVATVSPEFLVELDEYPASVPARPVAEGSIPPGTSIVTFTAPNLSLLDLKWRAAPGKIDAMPYDGRRVAVTVGPAGEWLEIVEDLPTVSRSSAHRKSAR